MGYLTNALEMLDGHAGQVTKTSPVYQTPAMGFEGDDFYNACALLETTLEPQELLEIILATERILGRVRSSDGKYTARTIDLDILFYEDEVIDEFDLRVPHPRVHERRFVLQPLFDLAPQLKHPVSGKSIKELLENCPDTSTIKKIDQELEVVKKDFSGFSFIAIEGNIGAGKTTLAKKIAADYDGKLILEQFADNPFLPKFYENRERYAFPLEMSFLAERYQQFTTDTSQRDLFKSFMVSDYDIFKSLIFAKVTLAEEEFKLYRRLFNFMYNEVAKPDVYVYLHQNTERLLENIRKRGRDYEQNIPSEYLDAINKGYLEFIKTHSSLNSLIIDVSELDFVQKPEDYQYIIDQIHEFGVKRR